jgi:Fe-S oxidoreductase
LLRNAPEAAPFAGGQPPVAIHAHCHTKALADPRVAEKLAGLVPGCDVTYLDTGCCGMAGQFGQLKEKYDLSVLVGRDLAEKVNALPPETRVVASGTSCRHQIEHLTGRRAWHLAEVLAAALRTD